LVDLCSLHFKIDVTAKDTKGYDPTVSSEFATKYDLYTKSGVKTGERVYKQLQETIGVADKEFIVDPTSGILRSIQCVCLPGITSYLSLWKKVMETLVLCFNTVLTTGDGSAGACKANLSKYVCDLVYEFIACFKQKYGGSGKRDYDGGIGGFFKSLTSAGGKVSESVEGRYGDSTVFKSIFSERKLVHSACLFAFTGTWDVDMNAMLEQDLSIDVESMTLLHPCTRRYVTFNPASSPISGLSTYTYNFGMAIVPGSKIKYRAKFVCSSDYSCNTPTGKCDCVESGEKYLFPRTGSGTASKLQVVDVEVFENVPNTHYRYDKVILEWESLDSGKKDIKTCEIKNVGGPAPSYCDFDIVEGIFRCSLGYESSDYARFYTDPAPDSSRYNVGDRIYVSMKLSQRQPEEAPDGLENNPFTKYLEMKLVNHRGATVGTFGPFPLNVNGVFDFDNVPGYEIKEKDFESAVPTVNVESGDYKDQPILTGKPTYKKYYITFKNNEDYEVSVNLGNRKVRKNVLDGKVEKNGLEYKINVDNIEITLAGAPKSRDVFIANYVAPTNSKDYCTSAVTKWNLYTTIYDKKPTVNERSEQITVYEGERQERKTPLSVVCKDTIARGSDECVPGRKVTAACSCGNDKVTCNSKSGSDVYCNIYSGKGRCEDHIGGDSIASLNLVIGRDPYETYTLFVQKDLSDKLAKDPKNEIFIAEAKMPLFYAYVPLSLMNKQTTLIINEKTFVQFRSVKGNFEIENFPDRDLNAESKSGSDIDSVDWASSVKTAVAQYSSEIKNSKINDIKDGMLSISEPSTGKGLGTGFVVGKVGNVLKIATVYHVVDGSDKFTICSYDESKNCFDVDITNIGILNYKKEDQDLAIINLEYPDFTGSIIEIADETTIKAGDTAYTLGVDWSKKVPEMISRQGTFRGLADTFTSRYDGGAYTYKPGVIVDIQGLPGNSGSPILNNDGKAIGLLSTGEKGYYGPIYGPAASHLIGKIK